MINVCSPTHGKCDETVGEVQTRVVNRYRYILIGAFRGVTHAGDRSNGYRRSANTGREGERKKGVGGRNVGEQEDYKSISVSHTKS